MKYAMTVRQPDDVLKQADEILITYNDINIIYDKLKVFPEKQFVVIIPMITNEINWKELKTLTATCKLIVGITDLALYETCNEYGLAWFWNMPIGTYYELRGLIQKGACEVMLTSPLYFDTKGVKNIAPNMRIRLVPNLCQSGLLQQETGIYGTYIRPEDVKDFEPYVDVLQFYFTTLPQEAALLQVYKRGSWQGNLNQLLVNLNYDVDNRGVPDQFGAARVQCRHACMRSDGCHLCETSMKFSRAIDKKAHQTK